MKQGYLILNDTSLMFTGLFDAIKFSIYPFDHNIENSGFSSNAIAVMFDTA